MNWEDVRRNLKKETEWRKCEFDRPEISLSFCKLGLLFLFYRLKNVPALPPTPENPAICVLVIDTNNRLMTSKCGWIQSCYPIVFKWSRSMQTTITTKPGIRDNDSSSKNEVVPYKWKISSKWIKYCTLCFGAIWPSIFLTQIRYQFSIAKMCMESHFTSIFVQSHHYFFQVYHNSKSRLFRVF